MLSVSNVSPSTTIYRIVVCENKIQNSVDHPQILLLTGFKGKDAVPQMVNAYLEKELKLDEFITHNMTLAEVNNAIELMKTGEW